MGLNWLLGLQRRDARVRMRRVRRESGRVGTGAGHRDRGGVRAVPHNLINQGQRDVAQGRPPISADEVRFDQAVEKRTHEGVDGTDSVDHGSPMA